MKELIAKQAPTAETQKHITADLIHPGDFVVLVIPIDSSAPKGRLILPQQQTIRDILEAGGAAVAVKDTELQDTLARLGTKPALVITDSQAFQKVSVLVVRSGVPCPFVKICGTSNICRPPIIEVIRV